MSRKRPKDLLACALIAVVGVIVIDGCSSSSSGPIDGGGEASHPPPTQNLPEASVLPDGSSGFDMTTGRPCMTDAECSPTGLKLNVCSNHPGFFVDGPILPTPVCLPTALCDPGTDGLIHYCDGPDLPSSPGICLTVGNSTPPIGNCLPKCVVLSNGSAAQGCQPKDACIIYGYGLLRNGAPQAVGYCSGGCVADTDCPAGSQCQKNQGTCLIAITTPTAPLGQPCSASDPLGTCSCFQSATTSMGYCSQFCITGPSSNAPCPSGYVCDAELPSQIAGSNGALAPGFTLQSSGLSGSCLQVCSLAAAGDAGGDAAGDAGGDAASDASGEAGGDAASRGAGACSVPGKCSTRDTAGPDCLP